MRYMHRSEVLKIVGVSNSTLWRWEREGRFPARRQLGPSRVAWLETEIKKWMLSRQPVQPIIGPDKAEPRRRDEEAAGGCPG